MLNEFVNFVIFGVALLVPMGIGFMLGLQYAKRMMVELIHENVALQKEATECQVQLNWIKSIDKHDKGDYNRRLADKILVEGRLLRTDS